eukprot:6974631-Pyramimonas_sp.AAC.1
MVSLLYADGAVTTTTASSLSRVTVDVDCHSVRASCAHFYCKRAAASATAPAVECTDHAIHGQAAIRWRRSLNKVAHCNTVHITSARPIIYRGTVGRSGIAYQTLPVCIS